MGNRLGSLLFAGGLSSARSRQARLTSIAQAANRIVNLGVKFASIPLAISILGQEEYGVWLTLLSLVAWLSVSDLGIPSALINPLAEAIGQNDRRRTTQLVSTATLILLAIGLSVALICGILAVRLPVERILGMTSSDLNWQVRGAVVSVVALTLGLMVLRLADVITLAMQKGYWGSLQELLASLLTIGGLVYLKFSGGTILSLALVVVAPSCVARLALWSLIVVRQGVQYLPRWRHSSRDALNLVGRKGLVFFAGTWGELLVLQTPNIVIAQTMGAASVPLFAVPYQVFNSAYILLNTISAPLWPAYAEAKSGQDYDWIRRSHWRVMRETLALAIPGFVVLALIVRLFIRFWAGQPYVPSFLMAWLLALLFVIWSVNFVFVILLTGLGHIRERTYSVLAFGVINLALAIPFANLFGVTGIVVALLVAMTATQTWYLPWVLYHRERWVFLGPSETTFGKGKDGSIKR